MPKRRTTQFSLPPTQPRPEVPSIQNNFVGGLKTEYTGLNFPENACTATSNCRFTRTGNVTRREGFDFEVGRTTPTIDRTNSAISTYLWTNAGGTGNQLIYVTQIGNTLHFYLASNATTSSSLGSTLLGSTVSLSSFQSSSTSPSTSECQYTAGNGYLFVFHPNCDSFYCTFDGTNIVANKISIQIRDFIGVNDKLAVNTRPVGLSAEHNYNLLNQGWGGNASVPGTIIATSTTTQAGFPPGATILTFTVAAGLGINVSNPCSLYYTGAGKNLIGSGTVTAYSGTSLTISINALFNTQSLNNWEIDVAGSISGNLITTWFNAENNYPSDADVWWSFKDTTDTFNPAVTVNNVTLNAGPAPKGYFVLSAFDQQRSLISGISGITSVTTSVRPRTGAWFQGRVWYAGVDASQPATGDAQFYTWTENIYFSQIITNVNQFGYCYETNDPTSEDLNALLPSDGGVIQIQGCGSIYKLFPVINGILVFAANGIWFITGSSGIGFAANDYTVSKVSGDHSISGTSFIDVLGWPIFWNGNGIYTVQPGQSYTSGQSSLQVQNLTLPSIKTFYQSIPLSSKLYARGSYNHITGEVQWIYKSTVEQSITDRYTFDSALVYLTYTQAFFPWSIGTTATIHSADYIEFTGANPGTAPNPIFKYLTSVPLSGSYFFTISEERNTSYVDWGGWIPVSYTSSFQTGYSLKGQAQRKSQPEYIWMYTDIPTAGYTLQGVFDYAGSPLSGRISGVQVVNLNKPLYNKNIRRHRIRGNGYVLQFLVNSLTGQPFNFSGWSILNVIGIQ